MKHVFYFSICLVMVIAACKSTKTAAPVVSEEAQMEMQLLTAKEKYSDITLEELKKGHSIFNGACTNCHAAKNVKGYEEPKLAGIMEAMCKKAELNAADNQAVTRYAMSLRSVANKGK